LSDIDPKVIAEELETSDEELAFPTTGSLRRKSVKKQFMYELFWG